MKDWKPDKHIFGTLRWSCMRHADGEPVLGHRQRGHRRKRVSTLHQKKAFFIAEMRPTQRECKHLLSLRTNYEKRFQFKKSSRSFLNFFVTLASHDEQTCTISGIYGLNCLLSSDLCNSHIVV